MSISAVELLRKSFGSLKTPVGQKIVGIFFVVQLLNFGSTILTGTSMAMSSAALVLSLVATLLGIVAAVGGLRSFRDGELNVENFKNNLLRPFGRILGSNLTSGIFAYAIAILLILPAALLATASGVTSLSGLTGAGMAVIALGAIGAILGIGAFLYVSVALMLAQPLIAIDDMRMFEALDTSIQRTKGNRLSIITALVGLLVAYIGILAVASIASTVSQQVVGQGISTVIFGSIMTPVALKFLEELSKELSED